MIKVKLNVNCLHGNIGEIISLDEKTIKAMGTDIEVISEETTEKAMGTDVEDKKTKLKTNNKAILENDNNK